MAARKLVYLFLVLFASSVHLCSCQTDAPQNTETFYPFNLPPIGRTPNSTKKNPIAPSPAPARPPPELPSLPLPSQPSNSSSKKTLAQAIAVTAASSLVISVLILFLLQKHRRHRKEKNGSNFIGGTGTLVSQNHVIRFEGNIKGFFIDEDGLDELYLKKMEKVNTKKRSFKKESFSSEEEEQEKQMVSEGNTSNESRLPIQEIPFLGEKSSTSNSSIWVAVENVNQIKVPTPSSSVGIMPKASENQDFSVNSIPKQTSEYFPPAAPQPPPLLPKPMLLNANSVREGSPFPPPLPPIPTQRNPALPSFSPKTSGMTSNLRQQLPPKGMSNDNKQDGRPSAEVGTLSENKVKLRPLHWDKVNLNVDHSVVWDKVKGGSFRFDDVLIETLFGYAPNNKKSPPRNSNSSSSNSVRSRLPSQTFILDIRKSQNTTIVLRSLGISRNEIIDGLIEGQGLNAEYLDKLTKIAPTEEEKSKILAFDGDLERLADAELYLYHLLKAAPSAFTDFKAMLFRSTYDSEVLQFKESLQTLELACKELRTRGPLVKLLEAILKAGNRLNAGTARGNAQAFNLTALQKLSDVRSVDGKTTLLRFVVQEVVRAEGKRCVFNRKRNLSHNNSDNVSPGKTKKTDEHIILGLPIVGGLAVEFSNVKKAATIDHDAFSRTCLVLATHVTETRQLVAECITNRERGAFVRQMTKFLDAAGEEINVLREEHIRVMELVKKITEYYQTGVAKDKGGNPFQLFVIVKDFLLLVDQACVDIATNMQKGNAIIAIGGSSSQNPTAAKVRIRFPKLPANFLLDNQTSYSSDTSDEF